MPSKLFLSSVILFVLLSFPFVRFVDPSSEMWSQTYGGDLDDMAAAIVQTGDGGYAIAGTTYSFGAGNADFWLIKVDANGNMEWNQTYGGPKSDVADAMVQSSDGGYAIAGQTYSFGAGDSDFWLVKVDSSGSMQWNRTYGQTAAEIVNSVTQTNDGGYALAGYSIDSNASRDLWFVKTDPLGNKQWNRTCGGSGNDYANSIVQTSDGGYALAGTTNSFSDDGQSDFWLVKTDLDGNVVWNKTYTEQKTDNAKVVVQTSEGKYTIAGHTTRAIVDTPDVWVANVDSEGNIEWDISWGPTEPALTNSMIQTIDGGYAVTGWTSSLKGFPGLRSYMFLIKVEVNGNIQWIRTYEGLGDSNNLFTVQTDDGVFALAGTTRSSYENAHYDIWFAKADAEGELIPEFFSWTPILTALIAFSVLAVIYRRRLSKANRRRVDQ